MTGVRDVRHCGQNSFAALALQGVSLAENLVVLPGVQMERGRMFFLEHRRCLHGHHLDYLDSPLFRHYGQILFLEQSRWC